MKSIMICFVLFLVAGCGGDVGQDAAETRKAAGLEDLKTAAPRETADILKTQWERFGLADDTREQGRALEAIARLGARAESEIAKLQEIADSSDYDDTIREQAKNTIDFIKTKVEEAN